MRVIIESDPAAVARTAADFVASLLARKPDAVLGLATGSTPLGLYSELIRRRQADGLDFSRITTFNLDEYVGLPRDHEQSYHRFMHENLFQGINISPDRVHIPDGLAADYDVWCAMYEELIHTCGGIDLQVLGIGVDGHIAFNEPGSSLGSRTRLKMLAPETIRDNARFFGSVEAVPKLAVTMGVGTILESRRCLLLATGEKKAEAIAATIEGPVTAQVTASALQLHRDVVAIVDEAAAAKLARREYYNEVERMQRELEARSRRPTPEQG
ncbi:MAG TPA: glucosamine-6-phosphate deaminase [Pirellulales bacterium]